MRTSPSDSNHPRQPEDAPTDLLFAFLGDVRKSSRALRQLRAIVELGLSVHVVMVSDEPALEKFADDLDLGPRFLVTTLPLPQHSGPRFFLDGFKSLKLASLDLSASIYFASDLYALPVMTRVAKKHEGKVVFDSRELYAHLDSSAGKPWISLFWSTLERRHIRKADVVVTVNDSIADRLKEAYRIERPVVVRNVPGYDHVEKSNRLREELNIPAERKIVLYQGGLRPGRGLFQLIEAVKHVKRAHLVIIGDGPLKDGAMQAAQPLGDRVDFIPFTLPDELLSLTASADLGAVLIEPLTESLRLALPNKLFEYLIAGIPVLASPIPEMKRVVETFNVGVLAHPDDPVQLVNSLETALFDETQRAEWRDNADRAMKSYSWANDKVLFQQTIEQLLAS